MKIYSFKDAYELYNALCVASPKERRNIIKGANLNIKDNRGYTALMEAVSDGHEGIAKSLLKVVEQQHTEELNEAEQQIDALNKSVEKLESKNAALTQQADKNKKQKVLNDFLAKKREERLLRAIRLGRVRGCK